MTSFKRLWLIFHVPLLLWLPIYPSPSLLFIKITVDSSGALNPDISKSQSLLPFAYDQYTILNESRQLTEIRKNVWLPNILQIINVPMWPRQLLRSGVQKEDTGIWILQAYDMIVGLNLIINVMQKIFIKKWERKSHTHFRLTNK